MPGHRLHHPVGHQLYDRREEPAADLACLVNLVSPPPQPRTCTAPGRAAGSTTTGPPCGSGSAHGDPPGRFPVGQGAPSRRAGRLAFSDSVAAPTRPRWYVNYSRRSAVRQAATTASQPSAASRRSPTPAGWVSSTPARTGGQERSEQGNGLRRGVTNHTRITVISAQSSAQHRETIQRVLIARIRPGPPGPAHPDRLAGHHRQCEPATPTLPPACSRPAASPCPRSGHPLIPPLILQHRTLRVSRFHQCADAFQRRLHRRPELWLKLVVDDLRRGAGLRSMSIVTDSAVHFHGCMTIAADEPGSPIEVLAQASAAAMASAHRWWNSSDQPDEDQPHLILG